MITISWIQYRVKEIREIERGGERCNPIEGKSNLNRQLLYKKAENSERQTDKYLNEIGQTKI